MSFSQVLFHISFVITVNALKFRTLFSLCSQIKCWLSGLEVTKGLSEIAKREDPDQTASSEAV